MKTIHAKVKPLITAMALASASIGTLNAQPIVSIGGSINASAAASISSSVPTLNASHSFNLGYSGNADVALPSDTDAVQSVINELSADSSNQGSLAGLGDMPQQDDSSTEQPSGEGSASLVTDTASEISGKLQGGNSPSPSGDFIVSSATSTASEVSGKLQSSDPGNNGDNASQDETDTSGDEVASSDQQPETPDPAQSTEDVAANASLVSETTGDVAGRVSSGGEPGQRLDVLASAANRSTADLTARLDESSPQDAAPETDSGDQQPDPQDEGEEVVEAPDSQPGMETAELTATAENRSKAEAFARLYR